MNKMARLQAIKAEHEAAGRNLEAQITEGEINQLRERQAAHSQQMRTRRGDITGYAENASGEVTAVWRHGIGWRRDWVGIGTK